MEDAKQSVKDKQLHGTPPKEQIEPERYGKKSKPGSKDSERRILAAAEMVFAEKGLNGARVKDISDLSQVNAALINYYFGSKENLYRTVIENFFMRVERTAMSIMEQELNGKDKLYKLIESGIDVLGESEHISRILIREFVDSGKYTERITKSYLRRILATTNELLPPEVRQNEAYQSKVMHFAFSTLGSMILFFLMGPAVRDIWNRDAFSKRMIEERKKEVIDLIFGGIGSMFSDEHPKPRHVEERNGGK